jgi:hypothetical protein
MFEVSEIEEKFEQNEKKLEALYARVETLERLSFRDRPGNSESDVVRSEELVEPQENSEEQQV